MYKIFPLTLTEFSQNTRVLVDPATKEALVIDPGGEPEKILSLLSQQNLKLTQIWLTHSHLDHCGAVAAIKKATTTKLLAHAAEKYMREHVADIAAMYGIPDGYDNCPEPDQYINQGDQLSFAGENFEVRFTPGHSPGHVCFYDSANKILLAGDTVFSGSIGRSDLPGGDGELLLRSIKEKILSLPDNTRILPGHGPDTTVGQERKSNPFLQA